MDVRERHDSLRHGLHELLAALRDFEALLEGDATKAASHGALLLTGEAGQGKTHLFCDAAQRAVNDSRPAMVLLGGPVFREATYGPRLPSGWVSAKLARKRWSEQCRPRRRHRTHRSCCWSTRLNESENPRAWQNELPGLLAEVAQNPWISVGVSVRSTYRDIVLPAAGLSGVVEVHHQGFASYELEATERFFNAFGLEQPGMPLLAPEFTNPLFLKLYCEGLRDMGLSAPAGR